MGFTGSSLGFSGGNLTLSGDSASPGNSYFYGTNSSGTKGWYVQAGSGTTTNALTMNNSGSGAASGTTFNGASAVTISYNTIGAQPLATNLTSLAGLTYASTSFVKMTGANTFALDTNTYLTANQTITLSSDVTGSGATAITATVKGINGTLLSGLATGILYNTTTTGVPAIVGFTGSSLGFSGGNLTLSGDSASPGNSYFYGTNSSGTKGWYVQAGSGTTTNALTMNNSGSGAASGTTFNGASAVTISYNTIGAQPLATNLTSLAGLSYASLAFVKMSASGTFSLDTSTYLTAAGAVTSITGTANQITASASTGAVTLSLPTTLASIATLENVAGTTLTLDSLTHTAAITGVTVSGTFTGASANQVGVQIAPTVNQTGTSAFTLLDLVSTNTALGTGAQYLINARVGGNQIFTLGNATYGAPVTGTGFIITLPSQTFTATGTTGVANVGQVYLAGSTLTNASANTITNLATLMIAAAPSVAGSQVGTNKYALDVLAGASLFNGTINNITVTAPASASTLTIASGGSFITTGAFSLTLTATNTTVATFPTGTITLAQLGAQTFSGAQTFGAGVLASGAIANDFSGSSGTFKTSTGAVTIGTGAVTISGATTTSNTFTLNGTATATALTVAQTAQTSGVAPAMQITVGASTGITAATVAPVLQTVTATRTWATTGTVADQYEYHFVADTLASASASQTFTVASTVDISGPPIQGSNAILSNPLALDVEAGPSSFGGTAYTFSTNPAVTGATAIIVPAATTTFQTSPPATVSAVYLGIPTLADAAVSQTIATAATLTINGAPAAGTNITITNPWALNVVAGATNLQAATINGAATFSSTLTVSGSGAVNLGSGTTTVGGNLAVTGTVSGTGITNLFASPPAIGGTTAAAITGTSLTATNSGQAVDLSSSSATLGTYVAFRYNGGTIVGTIGTADQASGIGTVNDISIDVGGAHKIYFTTAEVSRGYIDANGLEGTTIGNSVQAPASFTTLSASSTSTLTGNVTVGPASYTGNALTEIAIQGSSASGYGPYIQFQGGTGPTVYGVLGREAALFSSGTSNNFGIYAQATLDIFASASGTATISITSANFTNNGTSTLTGNVGIGAASTTTSPLHISGLPTSSAGLVTGDVYSNAGILTIK